MRRDLILAGVILGLALLIGWRAPVFLTVATLDDIATDTAILAMMALAQMLVILTRGIDLSVAAMLALCGMAAALAGQALPDAPVGLLLLLGLGLGIALGAINGAFIAGLKVPPIVVTLASLSLYRGATFLLSGGRWVSSHDMPAPFREFPTERLFGVTHLVWFAVLAVLLAYGGLRFTRFGRSIYAYGGNPSAARYVGIASERVLFSAYAISGGVAGLCGALWVGRYGIAFTDAAQGFELQIIAACVIGGVSIAGGIGTVLGCLLGVIFLGMIGNALPIMAISPFWQMLISGAVILAAVMLNRQRGRAAKIILRPKPVESAR